MQDECFLQVEGRIIGPITTSALKHLILDGRVGGESMVRRGRQGKWARLSQIKGFDALLPSSETTISAAPLATHDAEQANGGLDDNGSEVERLPTLADDVNPPRRASPSRLRSRTPALLIGLGCVLVLITGIAISWRFGAAGFVDQLAEWPGVASVGDQPPIELELADLIERTEPAVVRIDVVTRTGTSVGSGFVVSSEGHIVTNYHVVEDAIGAVVRFQGGEVSEVQGVLYSDESRDIAIITINAEPLGELQILRLADKVPRKGDRVVALGAPKGLSFSAAEGMVSGVRTGESIVSDLGLRGGLSYVLSGTWIQTTTPISSGSSGGPLVNLRGEAVGANTFVLREAQNLNFAISAADIRDALSRAADAPLVTLAEFETSRGGGLTHHIVGIDSELSEGAREFLEAVEAEREQRVQRLKRWDAAFANAQVRLKRAMIQWDRVAQEEARRQIAEIAREINGLVNSRDDANIPNLDPHNPLTGQIGRLDVAGFEVLQVTDKRSGSALVIPRNNTGRYGKTLFVQGVDLSSIADGDVLTVSPTLLFEVYGTRTYDTVVGGTNTVFVFSCFFDLDRLEKVDLSRYRKTGVEEPSFTADERAIIDSQKEMHAQEAWKSLRAIARQAA